MKVWIGYIPISVYFEKDIPLLTRYWTTLDIFYILANMQQVLQILLFIGVYVEVTIRKFCLVTLYDICRE